MIGTHKRAFLQQPNTTSHLPPKTESSPHFPANAAPRSQLAKIFLTHLIHIPLPGILARSPIRFSRFIRYSQPGSLRAESGSSQRTAPSLLMSTTAQIATNQANAQLSTGPKTPEGKSISSRNAVKTGLTGRTVLLPTEDAALYEAHLSGFVKRYAPSGEDEQNLVQSLADTEWRLLRIPSLEMGIYAVGRLEFADLFATEDDSVRKHLIEAKIFLVYQRQLNNLSIQEGRLRRQREKDSAALRELQDKRKRQAQARLDQAARLYIQAVREDRHELFEPAAFGFEFSLDDIEMRAMDIKPDLFADYERELAEALKAA